jgi:hypothetical protein
MIMNDSSFVLSLFGICVTGFLFLAGWMFWMVQQVAKKASYEWIKLNLEAKLDDIKGALMGTMEKEGLISRVRRIDENCVLHRKEMGDK